MGQGWEGFFGELTYSAFPKVGGGNPSPEGIPNKNPGEVSPGFLKSPKGSRGPGDLPRPLDPAGSPPLAKNWPLRGARIFGPRCRGTGVFSQGGNVLRPPLGVPKTQGAGEWGGDKPPRGGGGSSLSEKRDPPRVLKKGGGASREKKHTLRGGEGMLRKEKAPPNRSG